MNHPKCLNFLSSNSFNFLSFASLISFSSCILSSSFATLKTIRTNKHIITPAVKLAITIAAMVGLFKMLLVLIHLIHYIHYHCYNCTQQAIRYPSRHKSKEPYNTYQRKCYQYKFCRFHVIELYIDKQYRYAAYNL